MTSEDQVDLAQTYTGLDKRISEEFISIAMDPDRKSKVSSCHGSELGATKTFWWPLVAIIEGFDTKMKHLLTIYAYFRYNFISKNMDLNQSDIRHWVFKSQVY